MFRTILCSYTGTFIPGSPGGLLQSSFSAYVPCGFDVMPSEIASHYNELVQGVEVMGLSDDLSV